MEQSHWHAVRNVAGYLPESDEAAEALSWEDARAALDEDMSSTLDGLDYAPDDDETARLQEVRDQVTHLRAELGKVRPGQPWLGYSATNGGPHDIPTAWQITECNHAECAAPA
jgi:hypothetical protein